MGRARRVILGLIFALVVPTTVSVAAALPAAAMCDEAKVIYKFASGENGWRRTTVSSAYIKGPGTVSITKGRSWTVSASMTATVSAEAGVVFAKASASLGVTVGASYTGSTSFTYSLNVPKGKTQKLQQYKKAKTFTVTKYKLVYPCKYVRVYKQTVKAPIKSKSESSYLYKLVSK